MAYSPPAPAVARRRAQAVQALDARRRQEHVINVGLIAEAAMRARAAAPAPSIPAQRKGPARDPKTGKFLPKS